MSTLSSAPESLGAHFIDELDVPVGDPHYLRGSFRKRRYRWNPRF